MLDAIYWDHYYNAILLFNLLIVIGLFTAMRFCSGIIAHINPSHELLKKDNPAFGISLAAAMFAVAVMLSGTIYGSPENDAFYSIKAVGLFGIIGIALMAMTRIIFDKVTVSTISLRDEIVRGNIAVAIADAGNVLAAAIIIRAIMIWVMVNSVEGIAFLLAGWAISQAVLTAMTLAQLKMFGLLNKGSRLQEELKNGNAALALRFAGQKVGAAFALATAARMVVYEEYEMVSILASWLGASVIVLFAWKALCLAADRIILFRADANREVLAQKNIAVGAVQAIICVAAGLLISSL
ncbi:MAG: DUF350 domain-containing protein [Proteobacteria bacterium]|nr:DUF350 domain-containing protein [Pseudomonadota bacterium]